MPVKRGTSLYEHRSLRTLQLAIRRMLDSTEPFSRRVVGSRIDAYLASDAVPTCVERLIFNLYRAGVLSFDPTTERFSISGPEARDQLEWLIKGTKKGRRILKGLLHQTPTEYEMVKLGGPVCESVQTLLAFLREGRRSGFNGLL